VVVTNAVVERTYETQIAYVNQQGRVYQKNLGPNTGKLASAMTRYDPDSTWQVSSD